VWRCRFIPRPYLPPYFLRGLTWCLHIRATVALQWHCCFCALLIVFKGSIAATVGFCDSFEAWKYFVFQSYEILID
jgi:hypothetical protein